MKIKLLFSCLIAGAAIASAQGFKDGVQYFRADQPEEAEIILTRTLNDPTTDVATAKYYLGQVALQADNFNAARTFFEEGIAADPKNAFNYVGLGELALNQNNASAASDFFKQAKSLDKKNAIMLTDIARAYYNTDPVKYAKDIEKTLAEAKKANKNCPAIYILEADMLAPSNVGEAAGYYEMAMNLDPEVNHPEAYVKYARTYFPVNRQFAINGIKRLVELQPNSALAQRELAEKYYDNDQYTLAAEQYGKYIQNPNHFKRDEQRYVGLLYFGKNYDQSLALARKILSEDPGNFYMRRMEFLNLAALKQNEEAAQKGRTFTASNAGEFTANDFTTYGDVLFELGQDSLAVIQYEKAVELVPDRAKLLTQLSDAYTQAKMYGKAAEAQQRFIDAGDYVTNDLMILARRYQNAAATAETPELRNQYVTKGLEATEIVNQKVPDNYQVLITKARLMLIGNGGEVTAPIVAAFNDVLTNVNNEPDGAAKHKSDLSFIYNQLGKYYLGQKDTYNTKLYFGKMLELNPDNTELRTFVESLK